MCYKCPEQFLVIGWCKNLSDQESETHSRPAVQASVAGDVFTEGARSILSASFAPMLLAIGLAVLGAAIASRTSVTARLSNLDLTRTGFSDSYLIYAPSDRERAFLLRRRDATVRRSDLGIAGQRWSWARFGDVEGRAHWLLHSSAGGVLLLPLDAVEDWLYPFVYGFVGETRPESGLPLVEWTQLFVNRVYQGLYLLIDWAPQETGRHPSAGDEFVLVDEAGPRSISTGLELGTLYEQISRAGVVPQLEPPDSVLLWLAEHQPGRESVLLLPDSPPFALRLMPLPFSLSEVFELRAGRELEGQLPALWAPDKAHMPEAPEMIPLEDTELQQMREQFAEYEHDLRAAIEADRRVFGRSGSTSGSERGSSIESLGLELEVEEP